MKKAKRQVNNFINHLFVVYNVPRIPVYIHWHYNSVINEHGQGGFGVFCWESDGTACIHIACKQIGKTGALSTFAHEFVHYLQYLHGWDMDDDACERAAEYYGAGLMGQWLVNKKDKNIRIDGLMKVWERCPKDDADG